MSATPGVLAVLLSTAALAAPLQDAGSKPSATAVRGIAGAVEFKAPGPRIRASATQSLTSPVVVRVADATTESEGQTKYRVEFIGMIAGDHDLRASLERQDGSALDLPPITARILSQLTPDHGTDLFSSAESPILRPTLYRVGMIALGVAWAGVPIAYVAVRAARRKQEAPPPPEVPPPSFADQLRPLVQSAIAGSLSIAERGRLELLLYLYWRGRLNLAGRQAEVVPRLRTDPQAGALLRAVEYWLHGRRDDLSRAEGEVAALLEPYRHAPAIDAPSVTAGGAA
jgi:hypothetical protein